jgi:hypothetical protein
VPLHRGDALNVFRLHGRCNLDAREKSVVSANKNLSEDMPLQMQHFNVYQQIRGIYPQKHDAKCSKATLASYMQDVATKIEMCCYLVQNNVTMDLYH